MTSEELIPINMQIVDNSTLSIDWNDGHKSVYSMRILRANCPCAECVDEITGKRTVSLDDIPANIRAAEAKPVGRYAYQFTWSDRHDTGIYTYKYLRALCGCKECSGS
ncbi:MAG: DUF971 domain-containing protein [bacterium]